MDAILDKFLFFTVVILKRMLKIKFIKYFVIINKIHHFYYVFFMTIFDRVKLLIQMNLYF